MLRLVALALSILTFIILSPVLSATAEAWSDGIYDAESDDVGQAVTRSTDASIGCRPTPVVTAVLTVVSAVRVLVDGPPPAVVLPASDTRAPPLQ